MVDVNKAILLREQGKSYNEIAQELQCSVDWCKKNLRSVSKNRQEKNSIDNAIRLAQSENGITNGEIRRFVQEVYPYQDSKEYKLLEAKAMARFKAAINKAPNATIRPYWMHPQNAQTSLNLVLSSVDAMIQRMTDEVEYIRKQLDYNQSYDTSIRYAIIKLLVGSGLVPEGAENHCNALSDIVQRLEDKNNCTEMHHINTCVKKCAPKQPSSEKCIGKQSDCIVYENALIDCVQDCGEPITLDDVPLWIE